MSVLDALHTVLGDAGLLRGGDLPAYESDWRKRYAGRALAVARRRTSSRWRPSCGCARPTA